MVVQRSLTHNWCYKFSQALCLCSKSYIRNSAFLTYLHLLLFAIDLLPARRGHSHWSPDTSMRNVWITSLRLFPQPVGGNGTYKWPVCRSVLPGHRVSPILRQPAEYRLAFRELGLTSLPSPSKKWKPLLKGGMIFLESRPPVHASMDLCSTFLTVIHVAEAHWYQQRHALYESYAWQISDDLIKPPMNGM